MKNQLIKAFVEYINTIRAIKKVEIQAIPVESFDNPQKRIQKLR